MLGEGGPEGQPQCSQLGEKQLHRALGWEQVCVAVQGAGGGVWPWLKLRAPPWEAPWVSSALRQAACGRHSRRGSSG